MSLPSKDHTFALIVGVGQRAEDHPNMQISANDAKRFGKELASRCPFKTDNIHLLIDNDASSTNLKTKLDELAKSTKGTPAELIIIYFSGHGCVINDKYYLICRETINDDIANTALEGSIFIQKLQAIQSKKMLILLDCCHSGGMINPVPIPFNKEIVLGLPNRAVITACHAAQVSYLSRPLSIFTFAIIEGLAGKYFNEGDKDITLFDLAMYVRERVFPLSNHEQQPQLNVLQNGLTTNFILARYPNGEPSPAFKDENFSLLDDNEKKINTEILPETDLAYRQEFMWINTVNFQGDNNIIIQNPNGSPITINQNSSSEDIKIALEIIKKQVGQVDEVLELLRNQNKPQFLQLANKLNQFNIFEDVLIQKQSLIFVGRKELRNPLKKMLNGELKEIMVLKGEPKIGLSYIQNYLTHISDIYGSFDFFYINIQKIGKYYPGERVSGANAYEYVSSKLGMKVNMREFKMLTYINMLTSKLDSRANSGRKCLLYFDQFDEDLHPELEEFITALVEAIGEGKKFYIILAGYKNFTGWSRNTISMATKVPIESVFKRNQINEFLEKLYQIPEIKDNSKINWETLFASAEAVLSAETFEESEAPNIESVGTKLQRWYEEIRKELIL